MGLPAVHEGDAGEALAVLEGVADQGLLGLEAALGLQNQNRAGHGSKAKAKSYPSERDPIQPLKYVLQWAVHLPQNGTIGFDPQPAQPRLATNGWFGAPI